MKNADFCGFKKSLTYVIIHCNRLTLTLTYDVRAIGDSPYIEKLALLWSGPLFNSILVIIHAKVFQNITKYSTLLCISTWNIKQEQQSS